MAGAVAIIIAIAPLGHGLFLLDVTPLRLSIAAPLGAAGAIGVEIAHRSIAALARRGTRRPDATVPAGR
jgi:hypothetical protein